MDTMYLAKVNSEDTELSSSITDGDTTIEVKDASVFPSPPNIATIGYDRNNPETISYDDIDEENNELTNVTRGFQGTAQSWSVNTRITRLFTAYDHDTFKANIEELNTDFINHTEDTNNPHLVNKSDVGLDNVENIALSNADWGDIGISKTDIAHSDLQNISSNDHHSKYTDSEAINAINNDSDHGSTASHDYLSANDINSTNWNDYEIQKNGSDGSGIINFKT